MTTRKPMTHEEQIAAAAAIWKRRQDEIARNLPWWLATGEAIIRPCGKVVRRDHGLDDMPDGPYYDDCGCEPPYCPRCHGKWPGAGYICNTCGWTPPRDEYPSPWTDPWADPMNSASRPTPACEKAHPGQSHDEWGAEHSNDPKYKKGAPGVPPLLPGYRRNAVTGQPEPDITD